MILPRYILTLLLGSLLFPFTAGAQAYVPVIDISMEKQFREVMKENPDSIRNIIAAPEPGGVAEESCVQTPSRYLDLIQWYDENDIPPDTANIPDDPGGGPWYRARTEPIPGVNAEDLLPDPDFFRGQGTNATDRDIPREIGTSQALNYNGSADGSITVHSSSLRCLLISLIEWQKLSINIQIHSMLRDYIAQAQNYALQTKFISEVNSATIERVKRNNEECITDTDGNRKCTTRPAYVPNTEEYLTSRGNNQVRGLAEKISNDPNAPGGSLNMIPSYQVYVKRQMLKQNRSLLQDPRQAEENALAWTGSVDVQPNAPFKTPAGGDEFYKSGGAWSLENDKDGIYSLAWMFNNPNDTPLGASSFANQIAQRRVEDTVTDTKEKLQQGGGFMASEDCASEDDPWCTQKIQKLPGSITGSLTETAANESINAARDADGVQQFPSDDTEGITGNIMTQGISGVQVKQMQDERADERLRRQLSELPRELVRTAYWGYWNTPLGLARWTQATMLTIYDELVQKPITDISTPAAATVNNGTNASGNTIDPDP